MTRLVRTLTAIMPLLLAAACSNSASDQPKAVHTSEAAPAASAPIGVGLAVKLVDAVESGTLDKADRNEFKN
jgi:hypothetical protein